MLEINNEKWERNGRVGKKDIPVWAEVWAKAWKHETLVSWSREKPHTQISVSELGEDWLREPC